MISNFVNDPSLWAMAREAHDLQHADGDDFTTFLFAQVTTA
jgi:hypothetical protein